jgi:hypothetical protein
LVYTIVEQIHDAVDEGTGLSYAFMAIDERLDEFLDPEQRRPSCLG